MQLRTIAQAFGGKNLAETFGQMIRELAHAGVIDSPSIPNIDIKAAPDGLAIRFDEGSYVAFTPPAAKCLIARLREYVSSKEKLPLMIDSTSNFMIARKVRSVKVTIPALSNDSITKVLSPDLASDLADLIEAALENVTTD
ncbi:hypothetical protein [Yoonia ponticola]|uniref:hypothetical protein n=1 Tax=Yoonia ponticola TaxID=1524255 RepID=UPI0016159A3F|nr:hypothetical protein [Yoonia ponticola]